MLHLKVVLIAFSYKLAKTLDDDKFSEHAALGTIIARFYTCKMWLLFAIGFYTLNYNGSVYGVCNVNNFLPKYEKCY